MLLDTSRTGATTAQRGTGDAPLASPRKQQRRAVKAHQNDADSASWTATRCHRLLRPLLGHIAALQKERAWPSNEPPRNRERSPGRPLASDGSSATVDIVKATRRKLKYTYSMKALGRKPSKMGRQKQHADKAPASQAFTSRAFISSDAVMPTPVVRRIRNHQLSSPCCGQAPSVRSSVEEELAALRPRVTPAVFALYESVTRAFESLLRATAPDQASVPSHSKSLLGMCLRKLPEYIAGRQEWEREAAEAGGNKAGFNPSEVSFEIYRELENLGACGGWKHLRTVVRAHGVKVVADAVREGLLDASFCNVLLSACLVSHASQDGEQIVQALTDVQFPEPSGPVSTWSDRPALAPLRLLVTFADATGRSSFLLRRMSELLAGGNIPHEWLFGDAFTKAWSMAVKSISKSSAACESAIGFTITIIGILCKIINRRKSSLRRQQEDISSVMSERELIRALAALATVVIIGLEASLENGSSCSRTAQHISLLLSTRVRYILHSCLAGLRGRGIRTKENCSYLLVLTLYLISQQDTKNSCFEYIYTRERLEAVWGENGGLSPYQYDSTVTLIGSIAQCCGRGSASPSSSYLTLLCGRMENLRTSADKGRSLHHIGSLKADGAFYLAERTNDLRDLAFAEALGAAAFGSARAAGAAHKPTTGVTGLRGEGYLASRRRGSSVLLLPPPPPPSALFTGYRWEEGISEWVVASPATDRSQMQCRRHGEPSLPPSVPAPERTARRVNISAQIGGTVASGGVGRGRRSSSRLMLPLPPSPPGCGDADAPSASQGRGVVGQRRGQGGLLLRGVESSASATAVAVGSAPHGESLAMAGTWTPTDAAAASNPSASQDIGTKTKRKRDRSRIIGSFIGGGNVPPTARHPCRDGRHGHHNNRDELSAEQENAAKRVRLMRNGATVSKSQCHETACGREPLGSKTNRMMRSTATMFDLTEQSDDELCL